MTILHSLILGLVEGITEFLPISSTAHLEIAATLLRITQTDFVKTFEIVIQLGAILAVIMYYAKTLGKSIELWKRIIVAFIPTGIIGFLLYKIIKHYLIGNVAILIWTLALGGIIMIVVEYLIVYDRETNSLRELETLPYTKAATIGLVQSLAVIPGISRSAATIVTGRILGMSRKAIVEFSFLLAIPTMIAASGYDLLESASAFNGQEFLLLAIGFIVACISALFAIRFFLRFVERHTFVAFGVYRLIAAAFVALILNL